MLEEPVHLRECLRNRTAGSFRRSDLLVALGCITRYGTFVHPVVCSLVACSEDELTNVISHTSKKTAPGGERAGSFRSLHSASLGLTRGVARRIDTLAAYFRRWDDATNRRYSHFIPETQRKARVQSACALRPYRGNSRHKRANIENNATHTQVQKHETDPGEPPVGILRARPGTFASRSE